MRDKQGKRSVKQPMIIVRNELGGRGLPKKTFRRTGQISDQLPPGRRYPITFCRFWNTKRPNLIPSVIESKPPMGTRSEASIATSLPLAIATPTSAALRAGASFTPSPVTTTTLSRSRNASTMLNFCSGVVRAKTISSYWQTIPMALGKLDEVFSFESQTGLDPAHAHS